MVSHFEYTYTLFRRSLFPLPNPCMLLGTVGGKQNQCICQRMGLHVKKTLREI